MVYVFVYSPDSSMTGFVNSSLASFDTKDYGDPNDPKFFGPSSMTNATNMGICRYRAYRGDPDGIDEYSINQKWMHVFTARLVFIVTFEHLVLVLKILLAYAIPDSPNNLRVQLQRERQTQREAQFQQDQRRSLHSAGPEIVAFRGEKGLSPSISSILRRNNVVSPDEFSA